MMNAMPRSSPMGTDHIPVLFRVIDRDRDNGSELDQLQESLLKYLINRPKLAVLSDLYTSASASDIHIRTERANKSSSIFHAPDPRHTVVQICKIMAKISHSSFSNFLILVIKILFEHD